MSRRTHALSSRFGLLHVLGAGLVLLPWLLTPARAQQVTMETLLDRIQIEDLLVRYYYDLTMRRAHEMSEYFTEDALLDVDGTVAKGRAEIEKLYAVGPGRNANIPQPHNHMLLTNPVIEIKGNKAQAHVVWTGISNKGVGQPPTIYEQGREDTELVKVDGKWLISKRYISSDSGEPDRFDQTFKQRDNPLPPL
jgi:hypothetical protein